MTAKTHWADAGWVRARRLALAHLKQARDTLRRAADRDVPAAQSAVTEAVQAAREKDCSWGDIGEVLGLARGSAYKRYRTKPCPPTSEATPL
jgi:hypothetical protein